MTKKRVFERGILAAALAFALVLAACGGKTVQAQSSSGGDQAADPKQVAGAVKDALAAVKKGDAAAFVNAIKDKTAVELASLIEQSASPGGDFTYELDEAGTGVVIKSYTGTSPILIYPQTIEGYPVVKIIRSFEEKVAPVAVVIPEGVREIEFWQGVKLESVAFPLHA
jgi:hypothetical protein